ncbi:MAG: SRPBCC family protein [Rhodothermales bacterium]
MAFKIEERFEIQAPIGRVWDYLVDPPRVVSCLPGAELTEVVDEKTYTGRVRVKVGPVAASYKGTARLEEVNEADRIMRLSGEGKEATGAGTAKMNMTGRLSAGADGTTLLDVEAEIDVAGKMAQFGRGLMEDVSRQLFKQFGACMQATLAQAVVEDAVPEPTPAAAAPTPAAAPVTPTPPAPAPRPVGVVSLVLRALWGRVKRAFGGR